MTSVKTNISSEDSDKSWKKVDKFKKSSIKYCHTCQLNEQNIITLRKTDCTLNLLHVVYQDYKI